MIDQATKLRTWTVDWNGAPMVDGEPPRDGLHCRDLRDAAAEIERLRAALNSIVGMALGGVGIGKIHETAVNALRNDEQARDGNG